jgi:hypothetical protein
MGYRRWDLKLGLEEDSMARRKSRLVIEFGVHFPRLRPCTWQMRLSAKARDLAEGSTKDLEIE